MAWAEFVRINATTLSLELSDGRVISAPLAWYPRLLHGSARERSNWRLIGGGHGVHWSDLDEDISVAGLLAGPLAMLPMSDGRSSPQRWVRIEVAEVADTTGKATSARRDFGEAARRDQPAPRPPARQRRAVV